MTNQTFHRPDAMPLREALRGLRFFLRRGGETIAETFDLEVLPKPASDIVSVALREAEGFIRSVEGIASDVAKALLGGTNSSAAPLQDFMGKPQASADFGVAFYVALTEVLRHLGALKVLVSEAAARHAFDNLPAPTAAETVESRAAKLTLCLLETRVMRGITAQQAALVPGGALEPASLFAVMLWLQAARSDDENEATLLAASDMAVVLAPEISVAVAQKNTGQIAALFKKYVAHV